MPIETIITEAKKTIPLSFINAHAWLQDVLIMHHQLSDPVAAIRFFMLGLFASNAISFDDWHEFDLLVTAKNEDNLH